MKKVSVEERAKILTVAFANDSVKEIKMHHQEPDNLPFDDWNGRHTVDIIFKSGRILRFFGPCESQFVEGYDNGEWITY